MEGRNGWEYEANEGFCRIIDVICAHPEQCATAGDASEQIAENFDKSNFAQRIEDVCEAVVPGK